MMMISMDDVVVLIEFFKDHVVKIKRGAKVLLERIEDFGDLAVTGNVADFSGIQTNNVQHSMALDDETMAGSGIESV